MAVAKKTVEQITQELDPKQSNKTFAKVAHLAIGIDLLGSTTSLVAKRGTTLEVTQIGIKAHSEKSNRTIVIPYSNIKGFELI